VDVVSLLPCAVSPDRARARDLMRPSVATYAGFFPRYNRLIAESGFAAAAADIKRVWDTGDRAAAARAVPDALVDAIALAGPAAACRERIEQYRRAGLSLPVISPRLAGPDPMGQALAAIRACAP
jgi:hypothetical protein